MSTKHSLEPCTRNDDSFLNLLQTLKNDLSLNLKVEIRPSDGSALGSQSLTLRPYLTFKGRLKTPTCMRRPLLLSLDCCKYRGGAARGNVIVAKTEQQQKLVAVMMCVGLG